MQAPEMVLRVRGRVVDAAGSLVHGGEIVARAFEDSTSTEESTGSTVATPADGTFEIELARPSELSLSGAEGFCTVVSALVHDAESARIEHEIIAAPMPKLHGTVVHENGAELRGVFVRERLPADFLERLTAVPPQNRRFCPERWVETAADGSFALPVLLVSGATLEVVDEDHVVASILVPPDVASEVRIVCMPQRVAGVVVDEFGEPRAGLEVAWGYAGSHSTVTDASGAFELSPGGLLVLPHSWLHVRDEFGTSVCWNFDERWHARDTSRPLRIVLPSAESSIRGVVVDASGAPVPNWFVTSKPIAQGGSDVVLTRKDHPAARTGPDGSFHLQYLEPGSHDLIASSPDGWAAFTAEGVETGRADVTMRVPADLVIPLLRGRVETGTCETQAGIRVVFHQPVEGGCVRYVRTAETDAAGRFEIAGLSRRLTTVEIDRVPAGASRLHSTALIVNALDEAVLRLPVRERVLFERRRLDIEGDRLSFADAHGNALSCWVFPKPGVDESLVDWPFEHVSLQTDLPPELLVDPSAAFAVVSSARSEIARIPLHLQSGITNRIVWTK